MPVEIEAKFKVGSHDGVRQALQQHGARCIAWWLEDNTFFDTADHSLRREDRGVRIRCARDLETGRQVITFTYKGPKLPGKLKSREEIETHVDDAARAAEILARLGYSRTLSFQKKRESWTLGDCHVELDELPALGYFVEIEGPDEQAILGVRKSLGFETTPLLTATYLALVAEHLAKSGTSARMLTFQQDAPLRTG